MDSLYVVIEDIEDGYLDIYGIFNSVEDAQSFIDWRRVNSDEWTLEDDFLIKRIVPATAAGLL